MSMDSRAEMPAGQAAARRAAPGRKRLKSLRETAYDAIRHSIITCELRPGEVLSEAEISASLGLGRTPVHQALARLMVEGLIEVLPRKGVVVRPVSLDEILDIIDVRLINEGYCVRRAAQMADASDIALLERNVEAMKSAMAAADTEELMRLDQEFHVTLSRIARNTILAELLRNLHDRSLRFWFISLRAPDHHERVLMQHEAVLDAIRARDADRAEREMREHIDAFRINLTRQL